MLCDIGEVNNDFQNPLQVNEDEIFGLSDWVFLGRNNYNTSLDDEGEEVEDNSGFDNFDTFAQGYGQTFSITGNSLGGPQSIIEIASGLFDDFESLMLVFKGGGGNIQPDVYVAHLLEDGTLQYNYTSPFVNAGEPGSATAISHISLYGTQSVVGAVPLPAGGLLLLTAFGGLAFARRRKAA